MARTSFPILVFSNQSVTSSGTITSDTFEIGRAERAALHYTMSTATTGGYATATATLLVSADKESGFLPYRNTSASLINTVLGTVDSTNKYVQFTPPVGPYARLRIVSSTDNTLTFTAVWVVLEELV